ncbi:MULTISPECIES: hypothetical protein [Sphingobacterium]|uniref:Uncharacterized protein n=2 Tax=Sphingobacterium TaxID=28453 RepID=A0ACD5C7U8_9SPHI|nr:MULTISPECIES: hypothetical protein [Sphingobacterium]TWI17155.1 hypothetical protein IQ31_03891 [Sphingobacterium siyangense]
MVHKFGTKTFINSLWNVDKLVLNDPAEFGKVHQNGANIVQADYPELLLRHLRLHKLHQ